MNLQDQEIAVEFKNVHKSFNGVDFVHQGVDIKIPKGAITVLIGFSGTGKSVLLKMLMGLETPTQGEVNVLGRNIHEMDKDELTSFRRKFGVLFQNAALFDDMTAIENVMFPLNEHRRDLSPAKKREIAEKRLNVVQLKRIHYNKLPSELSGGMRKRVGLARAIALEPDIILYDEPTTGLDPVLTEMVDDLIVSTHEHHKGMTSIIVSHDLSAAFRIGDYVAMLDSGKILLHGTPQDFMDSDIQLVKQFVSKGFGKNVEKESKRQNKGE